MCQGGSRLSELSPGDGCRKCFRLFSWYNRLLWVSITPCSQQHHQLHSDSHVPCPVWIGQMAMQIQSFVRSPLTLLCTRSRIHSLTHSLTHSIIFSFTMNLLQESDVCSPECSPHVRGLVSAVSSSMTCSSARWIHVWQYDRTVA